MTVEATAERQAGAEPQAEATQKVERSPISAVKRQVHSGWTVLYGTGRRMTLAGVGAVAYVWDSARAVVQGGAELVSSAEKRGERMGQTVTKRFVTLEEQAADELRKLQGQVTEHGETLRTGLMEEPAELDEVMEKRIEQVLSNLGVPSRDRLERLSREIDELNAKIDEELRRSRLPSDPLPEP